MIRNKDRAKRPSKKLASIDGIVSDGRRLGAVLPSKKGRRTKPKDSLEASADRADGFHPLRQTPGGLGQIDAPADKEAYDDDDEPIVLDAKTSKGRKRHWFRLKRPRSRAVLKHSLLALSALALVGLILFATNLLLTYRHVLRGGGKAPALAANVDINQLKGEGDGRINILLLGTGGPGHEGGDLTDTILLASIDPINHQTALLSIPRDLWVQIPGDGYQKINAAFVYGKEQSVSHNKLRRVKAGLALLDKTLSPILGIPIHYHAIINFIAFREAVNAVGGVTVKVPEQLYDPTIAWENGYNPVIAKKGLQKFNGAKALLYVKSRETSSDFARAERQRLVLTALKDRVLSLGTFSNPIRMSKLLNSFGNNVYTDFSLTDLTRLYQIISDIPSTSITSLDLVKPPHVLLTTASINGLSIVRPLAGLFDYSAIQSFVRNKLRDGFITKENAAVAIYNATSTAGLATKESKVLKSYGYRVIKVDNTPKPSDPATTTVVDLTKGADKYTRHYLEARFHVTAQESIPDSYGLTPPLNANFVIILGKDIH